MSLDVIADPFPAAEAPSRAQPAPVRMVTLSQLSPWRHSFDDGSKFAGGYGYTNLLTTDYWTLRARSSELFETNIYARGIVRRLITNEINDGLKLQCMPEEEILGKKTDELSEWTETVENRFQLWCDRPLLCDQAERQTFGAIQAVARMESLVDGDVLVVLRQDPRTGLPRVQLIKGSQVQTPMNALSSGVTIKHGIEIDSSGRHVAFYIAQEDGTSKRLPAFGEKSGRRLAWLVYGTDKRLDGVRGKPALSLVLQSLKEIDRFRDAKQRAAVVASSLAIFVKKTEDKPGTLPMMGGAVRRGAVAAESAGGTAEPRTFQTAEWSPGTTIDELQHGEEPVAFQSNAATEGFSTFEEAIVHAIAWHFEIPPEILALEFSSNYSASKAAINEFSMYLNRFRADFGTSFCQPIFVEWLLAEVTAKRIAAAGLLEAWRDPAQYDVFAAWISSSWSGQIKPSVDPVKEAAGYAAKLALGAITYDQVSRETSGSKFTKNIKQQAREIEMLVKAREPIAKLESMSKAAAQPQQDHTAETEDTKDPPAEKPKRRALALLPGTSP